MKKILYSLFLLTWAEASMTAMAQPVPSKVDFQGFNRMTEEVRGHREIHLIELDRFNEMAKQKDVVILDTRSASAFQGKHLKGAIHLNFSDFTEEKLAKLIPDRDTTILIYCNNNFKDDAESFMAKRAELALNIPTFINLYGYGYRNVYELSELVSVHDPRLEFEGTRLPAKPAAK